MWPLMTHYLFDDLIIGGNSDAWHDGILKHVLDRACSTTFSLTQKS